jgi:hypothetical protein
MSAFTTPKDFITLQEFSHKIFTIIIHTTQVTKTTNLPKFKLKTIFDIGCDHLAPNIAILLSLHQNVS